MQFFRERWYFGSILSGALLILTFYPFHVGALAFVALVPLYLAVTSVSSRRDAFLAAFLAGALAFFEITFLMVAEFHWVPGGALFVAAIQYGGVIASVVIFGGMLGLWGLGTYLLRSNSIVFTTLASAGLYVVFEHTAQAIVDGFFIPTLAYEVTWPLVMSFASIGGAVFVSAIIAWINFSLAEGIRSYEKSRYTSWLRDTAIVLAVLVFLYVGNAIYLSHERGISQPKTISVVALQLASLKERTFGTTTSQGFSFPALSEFISRAESYKPDLIIYPGSLVDRVISEKEENVSQWAASQAPRGTLLMTWDNVGKSEGVFTEFRFWGNGLPVSEIEKKGLMPFMDYAPLWARRIGFYPKIFDVLPGKGGEALFNGVSIGGLVCSEVHRPARLRETAQNSSIIIAGGSESMFEDDVASSFGLRAAQYRAVEGDVPVVRTNILGPSALIARDGRIVQEIPAGEGGILSGSLEIMPPHKTLYVRLGDTPLELVFIGVLFLAFRARSPRKKESGLLA